MTEKTVYHLLCKSNADKLIGTDIFDYPVDPIQLDAFVADPFHELIFATRAGDVIGMASGNVQFHPDKPPCFFINEVGVNEGYRRQGVGAELVRRLIGVARDKGYKGIWVATEMDNAAARALYKKLNARETQDIVVYDWDGAMDD